MAVISTNQSQYLKTRIVPLTTLNLYCERVGAITNNIRAKTSGYDYIPFQIGGLTGQQEALVANAVIEIVDFQVPGNN
jgi:hypothetical protein